MAGKEAEAKDGAAEAKGGGKKKLIIIALPLVLILAGAGWFFFLKPKEDPGPVALPAPTPGAVVEIDPITINLAGGHYLQLGLGLQPIAEAAEAPSGSKALDLAISQFSGKTLEELSSAEGREKNKQELIARVKLAYLSHTAHAELEKQAEEAGTATKAKSEESEDESEESEESEDSESVAHEEKLTAAQAIKKANALTVQTDVYDIYFTEFVMK